MRTRSLLIPAVTALAVVAGCGSRFWPASPSSAQLPPETIVFSQLTQTSDPFSARLFYDYFRSRPEFQDKHILLVRDAPNSYRILTESERAPFFRLDSRRVNLITPGVIEPKTASLDRIPTTLLVPYLTRFIRFKAATDPRGLPPLTGLEAQQLASDIVTVCRVYAVPVELMIGIGAMENNYLNVPGDLTDTKWKRYPQPGDVVLRRSHGWTLIRDDSAGVWQITRESLRYAHRLFLQDPRDSNRIPSRLRPPARFNFADCKGAILTTYASLLLRGLLRRYDGDFIMAAGSYNGGPDHPNIAYAAGVDAVSSYARNVILWAERPDIAQRDKGHT